MKKGLKPLFTLIIVHFLIGCTQDIPEPNLHFTHTDKVAILPDSVLVEGYFDKFSYDQEETVQVFLNASHAQSNVNLGIYDVDNLLVDYLKCDIKPQKIANTEPYKNGYGFLQSASYIIPHNLKSGLYFLAGKCPFIVKNSLGTRAKIVMVHPSNTDIAYNNKGGMSLYYPSHQNRARFLSKARPWVFSDNGNPIQFYQWIKQTPFTIDYICDDDLETYENFNKYDLMILAGHTEYWTKPARLNFDKFIESDHNALIASGNAMYWQARHDFTSNQFICYKYDAFSNDPIADILLKTGRWEEPLLKYNNLNSIGANYYSYGGFQKPERLGFGGYKIIKPDSPLFEGLNYKYNSILPFNSIEYDGAVLKYIKHPTIANEMYPVYDNSSTNFYKVQILAYDLAVPDWGGNEIHSGMMLALKRKINSGTIINVSSSNWCGEIKNPAIQKITTNAIELLSQKDSFLDVIFW